MGVVRYVTACVGMAATIAGSGGLLVLDCTVAIGCRLLGTMRHGWARSLLNGDVQPAVPAVVLGLGPSPYLMQQLIGCYTGNKKIKSCFSIRLLDTLNLVAGMAQVRLSYCLVNA